MGPVKSRSHLWIWVPVALNALLYLTWRDWSLWCFRWVEWAGASGPVRAWRGFAGELGTPPEFVRFSLASGLWLLGVGCALLWIWGPTRRGFGLLGALLLGCWATEAAQAAGLMVGTADWSDVLAYGAGAAIAALRFGRRARPANAPHTAHATGATTHRLLATPHLASLALLGGALLLATGAVPGTLWP